MLYLAGFFISQLVLVVAVFGVRKEMAIVQIFIILSLAIAITLVGDFCIFGIIRSVMRYNEEELELAPAHRIEPAELSVLSIRRDAAAEYPLFLS